MTSQKYFAEKERLEKEFDNRLFDVRLIAAVYQAGRCSSALVDDAIENLSTATNAITKLCGSTQIA